MINTIAAFALGIAGATTIAALVAGYFVKFGAAAFTPIPIGVNASMLVSAAVLLLMGMKRAAPAITSPRIGM